MLVKIKIDTTGDSNKDKVKFNVEMYDALIPYIKYLITDTNQVFSIKEIDIKETRKYYDKRNGHCIYFKDGSGYIAAYDFDEMIIDLMDIEEDIFYLSDLCNYISKKQNIKNWIKQ